MKVFVLDNYDSFTFNLVQYLGALGTTPDVVRNDEVTIADVAARAPDAVVISPGPGRPADAGISIALVAWCASHGVPLLGVCLGHQAIAEAFGAEVVHAPAVMHGKTSQVHHDGRSLFDGVDDPFVAMRYHSLVVARETLPAELDVSAWTTQGVVMAIRHRTMPIEGVQFHPESVLTDAGMRLLENFCATRRR